MKAKRLILMFLLTLNIAACEQEVDFEKLETPLNLTLNNDELILDEIEHATSYLLYIDGIEIELAGTTYKLNENGKYQIKYKAIAEGYIDSEYSKVFYVEVLEHIKYLTFNYSIASTFDLPLIAKKSENPSFQLLDEDLNVIHEDNIHVKDQILYLKSSYLSGLSIQEGPYNFELIAKEATYKISITIKDLTHPYIYTSQSLELANQEPLLVGFDYFNSSLTKLYINLNGVDQELNYRKLKNQVIAIDTKILYSIFKENQSLKWVFITYHIENEIENKLTIGFIMINRDIEIQAS